MVQLDTHMYGKLVIAPWNIIQYNVFTSHGPDLYGVEPWTYYFINGFLNFNIVFFAAILVFPIYMFTHWYLRLPKKGSPHVYLLLLPMYLWILVFFTRPHKEERFLFPMYPMLGMAAAISFDAIQKMYFHLFSKKKVSHYLRSTDWLAVLIVVVAGVTSISRITALYRGYHASLETYFEVWRLQDEGLIPSSFTANNKPIQLCAGKTWHQFPSSFFVPANWEFQFVQSEFRGQLPKPFAVGSNATSIIPTHMNDMNTEETSRYVSIDKCHYLVDLDTGIETPLEPRYAERSDQWTVVARAPYLDNQRSHKFFRAFYVPWLTEAHCQYSDYVLLQSTNIEENVSRKRHSSHHR